MDLKKFVYTNQTHSDNFYEVTKKDCAKGTTTINDAIDNVDAIYTFENEIVLNLFYADCTPVYFYSKTDNLVGIIHAGWQGSVKEITYKTLSHIINNHNIDPKNLHVIVGPSIAAHNFEIEQDVIDKLKSTKLDYTNCVTKKNNIKYNLDVKKMNEIQAHALNITSVTISDIDTYDNKHLFSFRKNNTTGRMSATIYQTSNK
jgi:YfiH family protein